VDVDVIDKLLIRYSFTVCQILEKWGYTGVV